MNLVTNRDNWRQTLKEYGVDKLSTLMREYRVKRDSENWRISSAVEILCEHILILEEENERLQKELSLLLLSQITENDQKLGLYEGTLHE